MIDVVTSLDSNATHRRSSAIDLEASRKSASAANDTEVSTSNRLYSAYILLVKYTRLRFPDAQQIRDFGFNANSACGTTTRSVNEKTPGLP